MLNVVFCKPNLWTAEEQRRCYWQRPSISTTNENLKPMQNIVIESHRITIKKFADDVDKLKGTLYGKTLQGFCFTIMYLLAHCSLWFFAQKPNHNHASATVFTGLSPVRLYSVSNIGKTEVSHDLEDKDHLVQAYTTKSLS